MAATPPIQAQFYTVAGPVPPGSPGYIERPCDQELYKSLTAHKYCTILGSPGSGKSSLIIHAKHWLSCEGITAIIVDLSKHATHRVHAEEWYAGIIEQIASSLNVIEACETYWHENVFAGPRSRFYGAFKDVLLPAMAGACVIFFDHIEEIRDLPFKGFDFLAGIRECLDNRDQDSKFNKLTFCLVGTAMPTDLIPDGPQSPFSASTIIFTTDFVDESIVSLSSGMGKKQIEPIGIRRLIYWTGGHPALAQKILHALSSEPGVHDAQAVDRVVSKLFLQPALKDPKSEISRSASEIFSSNLDDKSKRNVLNLYSRILTTQSTGDDLSSEPATRLKLAGLVRSENGLLKPRNHIYETVLNKAWATSIEPAQELQKTPQKMPKVAVAKPKLKFNPLYAGLACFAVIVIMGGLIISTLRKGIGDHQPSRSIADTSIHQKLYFAGIGNAMRALESGDYEEANTLLSEFGPTSREGYTTGFEWQLLHSLANPKSPVFAGHQGAISSMVYASGGGRIATGSDDQTAKVWDATTGKLAGSFSIDGAIAQLRLSRDGKFLMALERGLAVRLYDVDAGKTIHETRFASKPVAVSLSYDSDTFFEVISPDEVAILSSKTGEALHVVKVPGGGIQKIFSYTDGRSFVVTQDGGRLTFVDGKAFAAKWQRKLPRPPERLFFSMNGKVMGVQDALDGIKLFRFSDGAFLMNATKQRTKDAELSDDGQRLVLTFPKGVPAARIVSVADGKTQSLPGGLGVFARFAPDGNTIAFGGGDGSLKLYSGSSKRNPTTIARVQGPVSSVGLNAQGQTIAIASLSSDSIRVFDSITGAERHSFSGVKSGASGISYSPKGDRLAASCRDGKLRIWDTATGILLKSLGDSPVKLKSVAFSPDGAYVAAGGQDGAIWVWNVESGKVLSTIATSNARVNAMVWPETSSIISGGGDQSVHFWDPSVSTTTAQSLKVAHTILALAISPKVDKFVVAQAGKSLWLYDLDSGKLIAKMVGHSGDVLSVGFSPDGQRIVSSSTDKTVRIWDSATGECALTLKFKGGVCIDARFSTDGERLYTTFKDGTAKVWSATPQGSKEPKEKP